MAAREYFMSQKQWESYLKDLVRTNDQALLRAIVLIYDNQTDEEKLKGESIEGNCIGFSKIDAAEMGAIASKKQAEAKKQQYDEQAEEAAINEYENEKKEQFKDFCEVLRRCSEEGISCDYGICDECPVTTGIQLRLFGR